MATTKTDLIAAVRDRLAVSDLTDEELAEIIGRARSEGGAVAKVTEWVEAQGDRGGETKVSYGDAGPIEITAPKGGDTKVPVRKGAVAKAIKATGESLNAIAREHGLNPSQLRRMVNDQVAFVDEVRAEAIAEALGADMDKLFGEPVLKAGVKAEPAAGK